MLAALTDTVIPAANGALEAAQTTNAGDKRSSDLNDQLIAALTSYVSGYTAAVEGLTNADTAKIDEAGTFLTSAQTQETIL